MSGFREVLAHHPGGVALVTAFDPEDGRPVGLTITAFCSVSADPPLVLVCVDRSSNTLPAIRSSHAFAVNLLSHDHLDLASSFSSKSLDKFSRGSWSDRSLSRWGPVLEEENVAHLKCELEQEIEAGDHWVFIGRVVAAAGDHGDEPLVYHRRQFRRLA